jgi:hypothetical protein
MMANLKRASNELFRRPAAERFETLTELLQHCQQMKDRCGRVPEAGTEFHPVLKKGNLRLEINGNPAYGLNDWSFGQLCYQSAGDTNSNASITPRRAPSTDAPGCSPRDTKVMKLIMPTARWSVSATVSCAEPRCSSPKT